MDRQMQVSPVVLLLEAVVNVLASIAALMLAAKWVGVTLDSHTALLTILAILGAQVAVAGIVHSISKASNFLAIVFSGAVSVVILKVMLGISLSTAVTMGLLVTGIALAAAVVLGIVLAILIAIFFPQDLAATVRSYDQAQPPTWDSTEHRYPWSD